MSSEHLFLERLVRTVVHPADDAGHFAAWSLDFGQSGEPQLTLLTSHSDALDRAPHQDEVFVWFGAPMPGAENALHDAALPLVVGSHILDPSEVRKAFSFVQCSDRWSYVAAHSMLRIMLAGALKCAPDGVRIVRDAWGKLRLSSAHHGQKIADCIHFNLSHTTGLSAVAVAGRPVGIDVEKPVSIPDLDSFAERFLAAKTLEDLRGIADERAKTALFFRFWTLGEAFIKATGLGLEQDLKSFAFSAAGPPRLVQVTPGWGPAERWRFGLAMREAPDHETGLDRALRRQRRACAPPDRPGLARGKLD